MKLAYKIFLFIVLIIHSNLLAQQIFFAESYTENGRPIGASNEWEIKPWGSFIYILLDTEDDTLKGNIIYLFIDKKEDGVFQPFDSKAINIDYSQPWLVYNYKFSETGDYEVYFITAEQKRFAKARVKILYERSFTNPTSSVGSSYYDNCKIVFCRKVLIGSKPLGIMTSTSISGGSETVYVQINNYRALKTSKILVDVWRKKNRAFEFDEYVESKKYRVNPDWPDAFFKYTFTDPGEYKFSIYNDREVLIKTGYFTVNN